jgi:hypothetical protein
MFRQCLVLLAALALLVGAGCGGDDDGGGGEDIQPAPGIEGAEQTVRGYLTTLVEEDATAACGYFTPQYRKELVEKNPEVDATDCEGLINEVFMAGGTVSFEGEEITEESVKKLQFNTDLRADLENPENESATVSGKEGLQTFRLEVIDGTWKITGIE